MYLGIPGPCLQEYPDSWDAFSTDSDAEDGQVAAVGRRSVLRCIEGSGLQDLSLQNSARRPSNGSSTTSPALSFNDASPAG